MSTIRDEERKKKKGDREGRPYNDYGMSKGKGDRQGRPYNDYGCSFWVIPQPVLLTLVRCFLLS